MGCRRSYAYTTNAARCTGCSTFLSHLQQLTICRTRQEFQQWAEPLAEQYGYTVKFWGAGKAMAEERALLALGMPGQDLGFASQVTH